MLRAVKTDDSQTWRTSLTHLSSRKPQERLHPQKLLSSPDQPWCFSVWPCMVACPILLGTVRNQCPLQHSLYPHLLHLKISTNMLNVKTQPRWVLWIRMLWGLQETLWLAPQGVAGRFQRDWTHYPKAQKVTALMLSLASLQPCSKWGDRTHHQKKFSFSLSPLGA